MTRISYGLGLPSMIHKKIYKTGDTRGAEKDTIYQNRVLRNSTVLIPIECWNDSKVLPTHGFRNEYIVYARPDQYFGDDPPAPRKDLPSSLVLGKNLLVIYETRAEWDKYCPDKYGWKFATSRRSPLKGQYIARLPDTTRQSDDMIRVGFTDPNSGGQGAGIRVYEYASSKTIENVRYQLAFLAWRTEGVFKLAREQGTENSERCKELIDEICEERNLSDTIRLEKMRVLRGDCAVCPLCLKPIAAIDLASRVKQVAGRSVPDLTVTPANLFHIEQLQVGVYNHRPYNLGWGHHHCNVVARDWGIQGTLNWMKEVLIENKVI